MITHDEYRHDVDIDEYGGRSPGPAALSPGPLIPVFGDSFAFGLGVRDAETFVSVIDARISARLINVGMPGSSLPHELDSLDALDGALDAPPACVFVVFLGNDLEDIEVAARRSGSGDHVEHCARDFSRVVERLVATAARLTFIPVVILIPDRCQVNTTLRADKARLYGYEFSTLDPDRPTRLVIDVLAAKGVTVVDASPCLAGDGPYYYVGDNHLTASGHRRVADRIGPRLAEVLDPRRPVRHTP